MAAIRMRRDLVSTQLERTTKSLAAQVLSTAAAAERFTRLPDSLSTFRLVRTAGADVKKGKVLYVTVHQMLYPIIVSVLHQLFGAYGVVLNLSVVGKLGCCEVLVQYNTCEGAAQAMAGLQGRCIYDGCCQLDIQGAEQSQVSVLENSSSMQSKQRSVTTTPKQVPKFDGTNMTKWRAGCEEFFELYKIPRVMWIIAAQMNMIGDAALWLQAHKTKNIIESWEDLCVVMLHAFGPGSDQKLLDSAEERHDIGDNKTLNAQSATSQDSVYSQTQVSHMHCPISKKDEGDLQVNDIFTHVGGLSLFLDFCSDSTDEMFDDNPLKNSVWSTEILEDVVTDVGGMSIFLELGLDSAEEIFAEGRSKDMVWDGELANIVLTHVGGLSLFLEFARDLNVASANEVWHDKPPWFCSAFSPGNITQQPEWCMSFEYSPTATRLQERWVYQLELNGDSVHT